MVRDINNIDDDIVAKKRTIEEMLYSDPDIIEILNNPDIDPTCPDETLYVNIYPFIRVPDTQDTSKNFITFMVDDRETVRGNDAMKIQYVKFVVFVHKDLVQTPYGVPRHDLLAFVIKDIFQLSNKLGMQMNLISNKEGVTDEDYCTRTLQFEIISPNSMKPYKTNKYERRSIVDHHDKVVQHESIG